MKVLKFLGLALAIVLLVLVALFYEGDIPKDVVDARYASPNSQFLDLGDAGRIHFRDEGNHRRAPIVLLHGSNASLHTFEPWVSELGGQYRLISIDLPGHGLSGEIPAGDYSRQRMIDTVAAVADYLALESFVIAGNSMGGGVAWRYALAYPAQVRGLILIDASAGFKPGDGNDPNATSQSSGRSGTVMAFELLKQPWFRQIASKFDPYYLVAQGLRSAYNDSPVVDEALIMRYYDLNLREGTRSATLQRFDQGTSSGDWETVLEPGMIEAPTLIMWGMKDTVIPFAFASRLAEAIPHANTAYYEDVGHIPMEEIPARSAADVATFMASLPEPG